jgi:hypothetical protein
MPNILSAQSQRGIGPKYQLSNGFTEVDGEVSFAYFSRSTTTPAGSTDLDGASITANAANGDVIYAARLKKGTRILFGRMFREALGASVTLKVGIVGADASFLASFDASAIGVSELAATYALGGGSVIAEDTWLIITIGGANPAADKVISGYIAYAKN